jgi:hypothetical protein
MTDPKHETGSVEVVQPLEQQPAPQPSSTFQKPAPSAMAAATAAQIAVAAANEPFMQLTSVGNSLYALDRGGRVWGIEPQAGREVRVWRPLTTEREET